MARPGLTINISGDDTISLSNGSTNQVLTALANQDPGHLTFPNELMNVDQGKNGTTIYAEDKRGKICELELRIALGSPDDQFLNAFLAQQFADFSNLTLLNGEFVKRVGDGKGNLLSVLYQLTGGGVRRGIETITSAVGNVEQNVGVWHLTFGDWERIIQ